MKVDIHINERFAHALEVYLDTDLFQKHLRRGIFVCSDMYENQDPRNTMGRVKDIEHEEGSDIFTLEFDLEPFYESFAIECVTPILDVDCDSCGVIFDNDFFPTEEIFTINRIIKFQPTFIRSHKRGDKHES